MSVKITNPEDGAEFPAGSLVTASGTASADVVRVSAETNIGTKMRHINSIPVAAGRWRVSGVISRRGPRRIVVRGFDATGAPSGVDELNVVMTSSHAELVPIPEGINKGVSSPRPAFMRDLFGGPPGQLTDDCSAVTNPAIVAKLVTDDVGPFTVTGLGPAVEALRRVFAQVGATKPLLFALVGTAGMLCCRRVKPMPGKPKSNAFSTHSWGSAIDLQISSVLDTRGDGMAQRGLVEMAPLFNAEGFYWGAGFPPDREDSMHFEASKELLTRWRVEGLI